jgi:hypothetical protein
MFRQPPPLLLFTLLLFVIFVLVNLGPVERTLGINVRVVYLHGAWVWTSLIGLSTAALSGTLGLVMGRTGFNKWSVAFGRTGMIFWITYLPLSLWAMQTNWNGLYLLEPRWRLAVDFAVIGLLVQGAIHFLDRPPWASALNIIYIVVLVWSLVQTEQVLHPPSPILSSDSEGIRLFFVGLVATCLLSAWQLTRWLHNRLIETP